MVMYDKEKIRKGLEVCIGVYADNSKNCEQCPYISDGCNALKKDILDMMDPPVTAINDHSDPITIIMAALVRSNGKSAYDTGFRNGIRYCHAILTDKDPNYEEVRRGKWIPDDHEIYSQNHDVWECSICHHTQILIEGTPVENDYNYCPACGTRLD